MKKYLPPLLLTFFFLLACQVSDEDKIHQALNRREEAFQKRDLPLYLSCISKAYQDKDEDFNRLQTRIEGYFKNFDQINYSSWNRSIQIDGEKATVIQQFKLEVEAGGKRKRFLDKEALLLRREGGAWKIVGGL